jgi:hypothetical protein
MPPTPKPTTLPPQSPQHVTDPTPGAPTRAVPAQILAEVQQAINRVYLSGEEGPVDLPQGKGEVDYDIETDTVHITLNMMSREREEEVS